MSDIRTEYHCVRIEVEIEVEAICGFAAGPLNLGLATRSHVSMAMEWRNGKRIRLAGLFPSYLPAAG